MKHATIAAVGLIACTGSAHAAQTFNDLGANNPRYEQVGFDDFYGSYYNEPVFAWGIFGLLQKNPTVLYPAGAQICNLGINCPGDRGSTVRPASADRRVRRNWRQLDSGER